MWSRDLPSEPSSARIFRNAVGHWYCSFVVEAPAEPLPATGRVVGVHWRLAAKRTRSWLTRRLLGSSGPSTERSLDRHDIIDIMSDILIRNVPESTVAEIDRRAAQHGMSRNEYLRDWLGREIRPQAVVTDDDLERFSALAADVTDPEIMRQAWS